ncbi:LapA family protein [Methylobacterium flocculans]|uniref:LapA family protein n=1 Tax=Methylobacterium flocculans TaxID=2984843 RepID=UPI0021F26E52|nr:LapA family protein [Methylobacterium sp. FF17]
MIRFLKGLVLLPVAILVVALAVANRDLVRISFDPFSPDMPVFSATLPLYLLLFIAVALGVLLGGCGAWLGQSGTRRTSAERRREIRRLESETARLKTYAPPPANEGPNGIYRNASDRVALPAPR